MKLFRITADPSILHLVALKGTIVAQGSKLELDEQSLITSQLIKKHAPAVDLVDAALVKEKTAQLALVLDLARQAFEAGEPAATIVHRLAGRLHELRNQVNPAVWQQLIPIAQEHPVSAFLRQDPFTRWSFDKPRGYSGDASLLDPEEIDREPTLFD